VLFQLEGADPFEDKALFAALDRRGVERKAAAPNKPPYKPELAASLKEASDRQSKLDPAFYCKPEGVPRMGPPSQILPLVKMMSAGSCRARAGTAVKSRRRRLET
jgi:hypothetical protein